MADFTFTRGNIFDTAADALVNPVNCVGVAGAGLALQFRQRYPHSVQRYSAACRRGEVKPGHGIITRTGRDEPAYIVHLPTKRHWRDDSRLEDIEAGLFNLAGVIDQLRITSIAIPPLGCGLRGLRWEDVKPLIETAFADCDDLHVIVFTPN